MIFSSSVCAMCVCVYTIAVGLQSTPDDPAYQMGGNRKKERKVKES
jgi:hypothetical protein